MQTLYPEPSLSLNTNQMNGKIIILSAPSGTGKSTIISRIIDNQELRLGFSISATSRAPRGEEQDGREYYFISNEDFHRRAERGDFMAQCAVKWSVSPPAAVIL